MRRYLFLVWVHSPPFLLTPHSVISHTVKPESSTLHFPSSSSAIPSTTDPYPSPVFKTQPSKKNTSSSRSYSPHRSYAQYFWSTLTPRPSVSLSVGTPDPFSFCLCGLLWTCPLFRWFFCWRIYGCRILVRWGSLRSCFGWRRYCRWFLCGVRWSGPFYSCHCCLGNSSIYITMAVLDLFLEFLDDASILDLPFHEALLDDAYLFL